MRSACSGRKSFDSKGWKTEKIKQASSEEDRAKRKKEIKDKRGKGNHTVFLKRKKKSRNGVQRDKDEGMIYKKWVKDRENQQWIRI